MNKLIIAFSLFCSLFSFSQSINWMTFDQAQEAQKTNPKKIIMDVYTRWCGPCKMLDKNTFQHQKVVDFINKNYYAVKFNAEGKDHLSYQGKNFSNPNFDATKVNSRNAQHEFASFLRVSGYPTIIFFDEKTNIITPLVGYFTPSQLELYLKLFSDDKFKEMKTREAFIEYQSNFQSTFGG